MLTEAEKKSLASYKEAATLNQVQVAEYFELLKKSEVKPVVEVKPLIKRKK
jgi:hypothetical protein